LFGTPCGGTNEDTSVVVSIQINTGERSLILMVILCHPAKTIFNAKGVEGIT
jgi:hypothetical protein